MAFAKQSGTLDVGRDEGWKHVVTLIWQHPENADMQHIGLEVQTVPPRSVELLALKTSLFKRNEA